MTECKPRSEPKRAGTDRISLYDLNELNVLNHALRADTHRRANAVGHKSIGKLLSDQVHGFPAGAMLRHNDIGVEFLQCLNGRSYDRLEDGTREVKSTDDCVNSVDTCHISSVLQRVHDTGVAASG